MPRVWSHSVSDAQTAAFSQAVPLLLQRWSTLPTHCTTLGVQLGPLFLSSA
jgi:hypothetical protein